jgi:Arm DNA-binding domain
MRSSFAGRTRVHAKLTQAIAEKCEPKARYEIVDTLIPGFVLRVRPSGAKAWEYRFRSRGVSSAGTCSAASRGVGAIAARRIVLTLAADVATGADIQARRAADRMEGKRKRHNTLGAFLPEQYAPWATTHLKTADFQISRIKADFAGWMDKPLDCRLPPRCTIP